MNRRAGAPLRNLNPYLPKDWAGEDEPRLPSPRMAAREAVLSLPFIEIPPGADAWHQAIAQTVFRAERFCLYADDASRLRVEMFFGVEKGGTSNPVHMPGALFADGPTTNRAAFVLHCSNCGAPTAEGKPTCRYCGAPFTWRLTETAFGMAGLKLSFPTLSPGVSVQVRYFSRSREPIGVDAALVGVEVFQSYGECER